MTMKIALSVGAMLLIGATATKFNNQPLESTETSGDNGNKPFAVVELFTSESCSSCPPADKFAGELAEKYKDQNVYVLAFHVDYWNHLNWKDRFSKREFTERQQDYGRAMRLRTIYTPQMIVNGKTEFVGSQRSKATSAIADALQSEKGAPLELELSSNPLSRVWQVDYKTRYGLQNAVVNVAVVENDLVRKIGSGENRGLTLHLDAVVRSFAAVNLKKQNSGTVRLEVPDDLKRENSQIIAFVQDRKTLEILGAAKLGL